VATLRAFIEWVADLRASCIGATPPTNKNWGAWLKAIIDERLKRNVGGKWSGSDFFQDAYQRLDAIKDAQRNSTMHVEIIDTEEMARQVFEATRSFTKKIASGMDESGDPKA
jgi:Spy/CpxP family protein refolding chaperone